MMKPVSEDAVIVDENLQHIIVKYFRELLADFFVLPIVC